MCYPDSKTVVHADREERQQRGNAEHILETIMRRSNYTSQLRDELADALLRIARGHEFRPGGRYKRADR